MIRVKVKFKNGEISGFRVEGHAGYAESGSDIVCASVSSLVINCVNSLELLAGAKIKVKEDEKKGMIDFTVVTLKNQRVKLLLKSLHIGLSEIAKDYSDYVSINKEFKEVPKP